MCPFMSSTDAQVSLAFNRLWFGRLNEQGIKAGPLQPWDIGLFPFRLGGWCADVFGALSFIFEVNDQYPTCKLTRRELDEVGGSFVRAISDFRESHLGQYRAEETRRVLARRWTQILTRYRQISSSTFREGLLPDIVTLGY